MHVISLRRNGLLVAALVGLLPILLSPPVQAKTKISYVPGVTLLPEVLLSNGQTPRTYNTPEGATLWKEGLPIEQGDKVKVNVFVATGGADLSEVKVRLDNSVIADLKAAPWNRVIDTSTLSPGYHMIDVWAQATGDPPQFSTKQLAFYLVKDLPAQYAVKGIQQQYSGGQVSTVTPPEAGDANAVPPLPTSLAGQAPDADARVTFVYRAASSPAARPSRLVGSDEIEVAEPTLFVVGRAAGGTATQFFYVLARDGQAILASEAPISLVDLTHRTEIKIQKRTETVSGLRPGPVTLWVWGIDAQGRPGSPAEARLQIL